MYRSYIKIYFYGHKTCNFICTEHNRQEGGLTRESFLFSAPYPVVSENKQGYYCFKEVN